MLSSGVEVIHVYMKVTRRSYYEQLICDIQPVPNWNVFNTIGHSFECLTVMVMEQIMADSARRQQRERFWIHTLRT